MYKNRFVLKVKPTAKQRPRFAMSGHAYKSENQELNEAELMAALLPHRPKTPLTGALRLAFTAFLPYPSRTSKEEREAMDAGKVHHTAKPDVDNLAKQLLDVMTKMGFWEDDRQLFQMTARKVYSAVPMWEVELTED